MISLEKIVSLAKRRGFIFPGSEIYGGLGGTWDYGPLGVELKNNIKKAFWQTMVYSRDDVVGVDAAILMNPKVWEASGHVAAFADYLVQCKICKGRYRIDLLDLDKFYNHKTGILEFKDEKEIKSIDCPSGGHKFEFDLIGEDAAIASGLKEIRIKPHKFNLLVKAYLGVLEDRKQEIFLRGEITQGVHVNFKNVLDSTRAAIPFGIAQVGKAFRNEITPGNFTFRSREFEQMELQFYTEDSEKESKKWYEYWKEERMKWYLGLGMTKSRMRLRQHEENERAHYAKDAWDIEYESPFGWKEFEGIHNRGDWDLKQHQKYSGVDMTYFDQKANKHYLPWIVETSGGVDRAALFFLTDAYAEEEGRVILKLHPKLAPNKAAVFPLLANKDELVQKAKKIYQNLKTATNVPIAWDDRGNIGKRYFAQDEIGTPSCITVDFQTLEDDTVTIRDRDTAKQKRIKVEEISKEVLAKIR